MTDEQNPATNTWFLINHAKIQGPAFFDEACHDYFQLRLLNCLKVYKVRLHAYALLPNEAWLLLTPGMPKSMFSLLDFVNECYSEYFNERFDRNTAVFQRRPFLAIIDSAQLFLDCQKMIERWPLASGAVDHPGLYRWSSYGANAFGGRHQFLTRHRWFEQYIAATENAMERYREFVAEPFQAAELAELEQRLLPQAKLP